MARATVAEKENHPMSGTPARNAGKGKERADPQVNEYDAPMEQDNDLDVDQDDDDAAMSDQEREAPEVATQRKRTLRADYRGLQSAIETTRSNLIDATVTDMTKQVQKANDLFKNVLAPSEAVLDSRVLMAASDAGALKARQLKLDANAFDTDEFIAKLKSLMGIKSGDARRRTRNASPSQQGEDDEAVADRWLRVGHLVAPHSLRVPAVDFMWGPLSIEVKERKTKGPRAQHKPDDSQRVRPVELHAGDVHKDPMETTKMVSKIGKILQDDIPEAGIPYLKFITNPESFAQTVENMFYFAFLIKEGKAAIEFEEDKQSPYYEDAVCYRCEPAGQEDAAKGAKKQQLIFELTEEVWRVRPVLCQGAIDAYDIQKSIIPTREVQQGPTVRSHYLERHKY